MSGLRQSMLAGSSSVLSEASVVELQPRGARRLISDRSLAWADAAKNRLDHLCQLPVGWDGYGAGPVRFSVARFAYEMLRSICGPDTPPPSIVPGPSGDLQVEWHLESGDVELHVRAPNDVHAWRQAPDAGEECLDLRNDFTDLVRWIKELGGSLSAANAAAA
ncbi:MAG: hypothetical protein JO273_22675 [Methylobacteriaceae bacterium]|nr:hypothetical protein [Methylobacteriaceae bacterium]